MRAELLCAAPPPPPAGVNTTLPDPGPTETNRQLLTTSTSAPTCYSCHQLLNPVGFTFENFDSIGHFRTTDNGISVDASGEILMSPDPMLEGSVVGVPALAQKLAGSQAVDLCVGRHVFRFAYGRGETQDDMCLMDSLENKIATQGADMRSLLKAMTEIDSFYFAKLQGGVK